MNKTQGLGIFLSSALCFILGYMLMDYFELIDNGLKIGLNWPTLTYASIGALGIFVLFFLNMAIRKRNLEGIEKERTPGSTRARAKPGKYAFDIVIMKKGVNIHNVEERKDELTFEYEYGSKKYQVKPESLYHIKGNRIKRLLNWYRGIEAAFMIVFRHGKKDPMSFEAPDVGPGVLNIVKESRALTEALKHEFSKAFETKKILVIFAIIVVIVLMALVITGRMEIPGV